MGIEIVQVSAAEITEAVRDLTAYESVEVGGSGAVAVAALSYVKGENKVAIVTGGDI